MSRRNYFRGLVVELECGHSQVEVTSFFRLTVDRQATIVGNLTRKGVWCYQCGTLCQPVKFKGTCKLEAVNGPR